MFTKRLAVNLASLVYALAILACNAGAPKPTVTPVLTHTPVHTPTSTLLPTATFTATATPDFMATQDVTAFRLLIQQYFDSGYIPSINGEYQRVDDYSDQYAEQGYYRSVLTGLKAGVFILRADVRIENFQDDFPRAGCGFIYHAGQFSQNNEVIFLSQNGNAYYYRPINNPRRYEIRANYYAEIPNPATVSLTLVVNKRDSYFFVDNKLIFQINTLSTSLLSNWGFAIVSGSSKEFGTRCTFTNIEFWNVK